MYILFCCPLPFENENIIMIQTNALLSWKNLNFFDKIIITGNENGVKEFCLKHDFIHEPNLEVSEYNTPLISSIFEKGISHSQNDTDILMYINCDIILLSNFSNKLTNIISRIKNEDLLNGILIVGQKINWWNIYKIDYSDINYEKNLLESINKESELHPESGIDYWIFTRNTYKNNIPPFLIGKWLFDGCLIHIALKTNKLTINATNEIQIIHQDVRKLIHNTKYIQSSSSIILKEEKQLIERKKNEIIANQYGLYFHNIFSCKIKL
jgi:hypothetical protein